MNALTIQEFDNNSRLRKKAKSLKVTAIIGKQQPNNQRKIYSVTFQNGSKGNFFICRIAMDKRAKNPTLTIILPSIETSDVK